MRGGRRNTRKDRSDERRVRMSDRRPVIVERLDDYDQIVNNRRTKKIERMSEPDCASRDLTSTSLTPPHRRLFERLAAMTAGGMEDDVRLRFRPKSFWGAIFEETGGGDVVTTATE